MPRGAHKLANVSEVAGTAGKRQALSSERFQDLGQGHSQDVYPLTVGVWGSSLHSSALVRQIGEGSWLGEKVLRIHSISFRSRVLLLQWGNIPILISTQPRLKRQTSVVLGQAGLQVFTHLFHVRVCECVRVHVCVHKLKCIQGSQKTACRTQLFLPPHGAWLLNAGPQMLGLQLSTK